MRAKQLTMRGLFNIGDQDHSPGLSKDEFRNVIVNVLGVHLTPQEFKEYWFRVHRGSKNEEVTFQHLLTYYGHLLDAQLLGKSSMGQDVAGLNKIFKTGDERLDGSPEDFYLAQILQKFSDEIARVKKEKHYTDMQIFKMYDTDKDSRISLMEFKDISTLALKLSTPLSDLDRIFMWVDKDKTGKIDLVELFKILKFNLDDYLKERQASDKSLADHPDNWSNDRVILSFIQALEAYMKKNELTVYQVYAQMDKKPDSSISRAELEKFIKVKIIPDISARHIRIILTEIDKSGDDKISVKELAKFLERSEVYKMINNKKDVDDLKSLRVLQVIHQYLIDHDKKPIDLIYDMDSDKSGSIDQFELADYVLKLNKDLTTADISQFLLVVDRDGSKNLSVKEIEDTIITYGKILSPQTIITAEKRTQLLRKLIPIIDGNKEVLKESFDKNEDPHRVGHMKVGQFMRTLLISHLFTPEEVELIINPICWPFTSGGRIRFSGLFELHKLYESDLKMRESGIGKHRGKKLVDQLFGALKKVGKKHKLNEYELFRCFDIDDSGFLTLLELR
jgi:Ca2+-binding EF-hand superfamily protein